MVMESSEVTVGVDRHKARHGYVSAPADIVVNQGVDLGRPSRIDVHIPSTGGISVTGTAVPIPRPEPYEPTT
jgi:predicted PhzF superfamily epimerase YddE/YHI9